MPHYIYTKDAAIEALGLRKKSTINRYIKRAKKNGAEPSKILGGIEYFDLDLLLNPPKNKENDSSIKMNLEKFIEKQIKERKRKKPLQLRLFFDFDEA